MDGKGTRIAKTIPKSENKAGGISLHDLRHSNQVYMVLARGPTYRPVEPNKGPRKRATQMCPTDVLQRYKSNSMEEGIQWAWNNWT